MQQAFSTVTTVLPGHRIEVSDPSLRELDQVQVFLIPTAVAATTPDESTSIFDIIAELKGHHLFASSEEVDRYINVVRNSWE